jgi:hypothetical protein
LQQAACRLALCPAHQGVLSRGVAALGRPQVYGLVAHALYRIEEANSALLLQYHTHRLAQHPNVIA